MPPIEKIFSHLGKYKEYDDKIVVEVCPFCGGGEHHDKNTLVIMKTNARQEDWCYSCLRGTCGAKGNISSLYQKVTGENLYKKEKRKEKERESNYMLPDPKKLVPLTSEGKRYLQSRGITEEAISHFKLASDKQGRIAFPFYSTSGTLVFIKYRILGMPQKGQAKMIREKGAKPILFNMNKKSSEVIVTEGEIDALSVWQYSKDVGIDVVSIPSGCQDFTWLDSCRDFLNLYDTIYTWGDRDSAGKKFNKDMAKYFGYKVVEVPHGDYKLVDPNRNNEIRYCNDPNELLVVYGTSAIDKCLAEAVNNDNRDSLIEDIGDIPYESLLEKRFIKSRFPIINNALGGYCPGKWYLITGHTGNGKTTFIMNELLSLAQAGHRIGIYSGEQSLMDLKRWMFSMLAGKGNIQAEHPVTGKTVSIIPERLLKEITQGIRGKIEIFSHTGKDWANKDRIFETIRYSVTKGIEVFLLDNMMSIDIGDSVNELNAQKRFILQLKQLVEELEIIVFLIAHPRKNSKSDDENIPTLTTISGSKDITNLASDVIVYHKLNKALKSELITIEKKNKMKARIKPIERAKGIVKILKGREFGNPETLGFMGYNHDSKRVFELDYEGNDRCSDFGFPWEEEFKEHQEEIW